MLYRHHIDANEVGSGWRQNLKGRKELKEEEKETKKKKKNCVWWFLSTTRTIFLDFFFFFFLSYTKEEGRLRGSGLRFPTDFQGQFFLFFLVTCVKISCLFKWGASPHTLVQTAAAFIWTTTYLTVHHWPFIVLSNDFDLFPWFFSSNKNSFVVCCYFFLLLYSTNELLKVPCLFFRVREAPFGPCRPDALFWLSNFKENGYRVKSKMEGEAKVSCLLSKPGPSRSQRKLRQLIDGRGFDDWTIRLSEFLDWPRKFERGKHRQVASIRPWRLQHKPE